MKNKEYQTIFDAIDVPIEKLNANTVLDRKYKRKRYKIITSLVIVSIIVSVFIIKKGMTTDTDYFFTTIYAENKSTTMEADASIEIIMDNAIFKDTVDIRSIENQIQIRYPLNVQIKGENIKQIKYILNKENNGLLYQGTSYQLIEDKEYSKLQSNTQNTEIAQSVNSDFDRKKFIELTDKEKEIFLQYLNVSTDNTLDQTQYIREFKNAVYKKQTDSIYQYRDDTLWKHFFWIYEQRGKEIVIDYNKQERSQYKLELEEIIKYDNGKNLMNIDAIKLYQDIKKELTTYNITIAIEYNNGIIKEKQICFKEVETNNIDILTGLQEVTVVMEIK